MSQEIKELTKQIKLLKEQLELLTEENEALWAMLEEIHLSDIAAKKKMDETVAQQKLNYFLENMKPIGEA